MVPRLRACACERYSGEVVPIEKIIAHAPVCTRCSRVVVQSLNTLPDEPFGIEYPYTCEHGRTQPHITDDGRQLCIPGLRQAFEEDNMALGSDLCRCGHPRSAHGREGNTLCADCKCAGFMSAKEPAALQDASPELHAAIDRLEAQRERTMASIERQTSGLNFPFGAVKYQHAYHVLQHELFKLLDRGGLVNEGFNSTQREALIKALTKAAAELT